MKIAVLGGGFTGLTASYYLSQSNHRVFLYEKEPILGGLSAGFKEKNWLWSLEKSYHHFFSNDNEVLKLAEETGFNNIFFQSPETASLFEHQSSPSNYRTFPVDTPQDFLALPILNLVEKIRAGAVIAWLKLSPPLSYYEKATAKQFLISYMGNKVWERLWQELFRKKFCKYADKILASFIWARIKKRTKTLGYARGGFQSFIDYIENKLIDQKVEIKKNYSVSDIEKTGNKFKVNGEMVDLVISTLPTPILIKLAKNTLSNNYLNRLKKINYLHAVSIILETEKPLVEKTYWLNINVKEVPFVALVQHTNMIDKKNYGNHHLLYVANYIDSTSRLLTMTKEEIIKLYLPFLKILNPKFSILNSFLFKSYYAQPVFNREFLENKPEFITPVKNFYIANLDMTYPYDRGTNYAIKLGREIGKIVNY